LIRAFIAVTLTELVIEEIAKIRMLLQETRGDLRWARMESLHVTLKFLGDIHRHQVEPILEALHKIVSIHSPLCIIVQGLGVFPNVRRPRVLWVGLKGEGLTELSEAIETALMPLDFPPEDRQFMPHLTLGRVRSLRGWENLLPRVKEHENTLFGESMIDRVTLYQSNLRPEGAIYTSLGSVPFQRA
jgi:2'-5' RNA ligase